MVSLIFPIFAYVPNYVPHPDCPFQCLLELFLIVSCTCTLLKEYDKDCYISPCTLYRTETSLEGMIIKGALTFFEHTMRASGIEKDVMLGKVEGTRRRGGQRARWLNSLKDITRMTFYELKGKAMNKMEWRTFVQRIAKSRQRLNGT